MSHNLIFNILLQLQQHRRRRRLLCHNSHKQEAQKNL